MYEARTISLSTAGKSLRGLRIAPFLFFPAVPKNEDKHSDNQEPKTKHKTREINTKIET